MSNVGLPKLNIVKKTATSQTTAAKLQTVPRRSTSCSSAMQQSTTIFGGRQNPGTAFGITAQRSLGNSGTIYNAKHYASATGYYSNLRHSINDNRTIVNNDFGGWSAPKNKTNVFAAVTAGLMGLGMLGLGTAAVVKSLKGDDKGGVSEMNGGKEAATKTSTSAQAMKDAKTSTALSAAISKAQAQKSAIPSQIAEAKSKLSELQGQSAELEQKATDAQNAYDTNLADIKEQTGIVNQKQEAVNSCQTSFDVADNKYKLLQKEFDACASVLPPGQLDLLKDKLEKAKQELKTAKDKLETAKQELETATEKLTELQKQTEGLKQAAGDAQDAYETNLKDIETKQQEIEQLTAEQKELDTEIPKQEKRLTELEKKEEKELTGVTRQVTKLAGEIEALMQSVDASDGLSDDELKVNEKVDKKQPELDKLKARQAELERRKAIRNLPTEIGPDGVQLKAGLLPDGTQVYLVDGKEVTQQEYEAAKQPKTT